MSDPALAPLIGVLDEEYRMLAGGRVMPAVSDDANCRLMLDPSLGEQEYRLRVRDELDVVGGSYLAVAMGTVTMMQAVVVERGRAVVPGLDVTDRPDKAYRGLMVDIGRHWHDIDTLEQLVKLCRWYKVNYLHLHLTDDPLFTFPTDAFPALPTPGQHYTKQELRELDAFARAQGVTLVPELDVPGHAAQFTQQMPERFGLRDMSENRSTINMGREAVYEALDLIVGEIAEIFRTSPFIHIGGDEASLVHLAEDPDVQRYMTAHELGNVQELYRHFLVRMNSLVRKHGKRTLLWEGFHKEGETEIPRDITVMAWETKYQLPQDLLDGGYTVINASWKPLYVVNHKKWDVDYIYHWNLYRWENWVPGMPSLVPIQLSPTQQVIGASMESWEQPQHIVLPTVRKRLAAMSERTWNATVHPKHSYSQFNRALQRTDAALQRILTPIALTTRGLRFPELEDGHYNEPFWFGDELTVRLTAQPGQIIHYTLDGSAPTLASPRYVKPVVLTEERAFRARAFTVQGQPVGNGIWNVYELHPIRADVQGDLHVPLSALWEKRHDFAPFTGAVSIRLVTERAGTIRYTLDGSEPTLSSPAYRAPLRLTRAAQVRAQLFDAEGKPIGRSWEQDFALVEGGSETGSG
jgi:hexosaminidase